MEPRKSPRISLNKLAEYLVATPRRRRSLILDQIKPVAYKTVRYEHARRILIRFFCDPSRTSRSLSNAATRLRDRAAEHQDKDFFQRCLLASARAVEAFVPIAEGIRTCGPLAVPGSRRQPHLLVAGVRVVVAPDLSFVERGTENRVGALKFHISSSARLEDEALRYAAALMYHFVEQSGDRPQRELCEVIDVFSGKNETTPKAIKDRLKNIEAACEEIAERWPGLLKAVRQDISQRS